MRRLLVVAAAVIAAVAILYPVLHDSDEDEVRDRIEGFAEAMKEKDYEAVCEDHLAGDLKARVQLVGGCVEVIRRAAGSGAQRFDFEVGSVEVEGDRATARVQRSRGGGTGETTVPLVKEADGEWRLAGFG